MLLAVYAVFARSWGVVTLLLLAGLGLAVVSGPKICDYLICYRRAFVWLPLGLWLVGIQQQKGWLLYALTPAGLFSLVASLRYI
jgi:hypothetical protein